MTVQSLLSAKSGALKTIGPKVRIETVAALLHDNKVGVFPVVEKDGRLIGIISERDIIGTVATHGSAGLGMLVEEVMTRNVVTVTPTEPIKSVMATMTTRRIRHLPVIDRGKLVAIISIGDVIKHRLETTEMEMMVLKDYAIAKH